MPPSVNAQLSWSLDIECPHCEGDIDLADCDDDTEFARAIFNNKWADLKGAEVTCPHCQEEFLIDEVEY